MSERAGLLHAALIAEARLTLYSHAQQNAVRECVSSIRGAADALADTKSPAPQPRETPTLKAPDRDGGGEC